MALRAGSWSIGGFKLPELGITEAAQRFLQPNKPLTSQGGSNLFGPSKAAPPPAKPVVKPVVKPAAPVYRPPTGGQPASPPPTTDQGQGDQGQGQFQIPSASDYGVPSAEEAARAAAEEKARVQQEKMNRFNELITPLRGDVESYLKSRRPITELFQEEMGKQGITQKQAALGTLESEAAKLGGQLETLPTEEIARRKETGMLTSAAERRIRAMEERPIREQLLKVTGAKEQERIGLQRAYELLDKILDIEREQEKRGQEPLEYRLKGAEEQFGLEGEGFKSEIDSIASQLTGFNKDREAKLKEYEMQVDAGLKLTLAQQKEATDLKKLEIEHLNTMEQIAAKAKGQSTDFDKTEEIKALEGRIAEGATSADVIKEFVNTGIMDISTVEKQLGKFNDMLTANEAAKRKI